MSKRLPIVLSLLALAVSVLGFAPITDAARKLVLPESSVGTAALKPNAVVGSKVKDGSLLAKDLKPGEIRTLDGAAAGGDLAGTFPAPRIRDSAITPSKLGTVPAARVYSGFATVVGSGEGRLLSFDHEAFDTARLHGDVDRDRLVAPVAGTYVISASVRWETSSAGSREVAVTVETPRGAEAIATVIGPATAVAQTVTTLARLAPGQAVYVRVRQNSGGPLWVLPSTLLDGFDRTGASMAWVGPG